MEIPGKTTQSCISLNEYGYMRSVAFVACRMCGVVLRPGRL